MALAVEGFPERSFSAKESRLFHASGRIRCVRAANSSGGGETLTQLPREGWGRCFGVRAEARAAFPRRTARQDGHMTLDIIPYRRRLCRDPLPLWAGSER